MHPVLSESDLQLLDGLLARSSLALVAWDKASRVSYWSARAQSMFGFRASAVMGLRAEEFDFVHEDDLESMHALRELNHETPLDAFVSVQRNVRADGAVRTCRWTTVVVQKRSDYHVISFAEDITEIQDAQSALTESEQRFRSLFAYNPDFIVVFSPDGHVVDVNDAMLRAAAQTRDELVGSHFSAFLHPDDVPQHAMYLQRALTGETLFYSLRLLTDAGGEREASVTTVPLYRNGRIDGAFSIVRDETEQRSAQRRIERQERDLADSENRLRSLFEHNPDAVMAITPRGTIANANDAAVRLCGFPREAIVGEHYRRFAPAHEHDRLDEAFAQALRGEPNGLTVDAFRIDGVPLALDLTLIPQHTGGRVVGVYSVIQDITERRAAERRAEIQRDRMRNLYFIAASGEYAEVRVRASLEMGCRAFDVVTGAVVDLTGHEPRIDAVYHFDRDRGVSDDEIVAMAEAAADAAPGSATMVTFPAGVGIRLEIGGEPYGAIVFARARMIHAFADTDADLLGLIGTLIAGAMDRSRQRARLRAMAYYDVLTGLPNRLYLSEMLRDAIEAAQSRFSRVGVLFLDLDRFKDVNDSLGHSRGDRLLQLVARRLANEVGERGTIARMGGDEFAILLTDCRDAEAVREIAEAVLATITEPFVIDEYEQFISTSIGISVYPEDGRDDQTLIKNADIAMYRAKDRGRNAYYFYNPTLESPIHMRLSQEKLLRRALELGEFVIFYQPQLDVRTGKIVSVEALIRWNHPKLGLIEPGHFIPSAEISGLIVPLGDWVLATAARQVQKWHRDLGPIRLAVNLSGRQFHQRDLRRQVLKALHDASLDPAYLEVEITESVAMSDAAQTVGIVRDLKASGVRIALDDFGTGYSSLAYLRRFALDALKIDGSFVAGIGRETYDETIVKTVVGMAHSLGLEVVAEGVESPAQLAFLSDNGCDIVQGFALSAPLPAHDLEAFVRLRERSAASG